LRVTALGLWLVLVALCGVVVALASLLLGHGLRWGLVVAAGAATAWLLLALAIRWWWLWIPLCLGPSLLGVAAWRNLVFGSWAWMQQQWQAQPLAATLLLLMVQGLLLSGVFGRGDARHARAYASRERLRKASSAGGYRPNSAPTPFEMIGEWLGAPWRRLSDHWLAHVCRHASPRPRSVMARAEVVLHGPQHWVRQISTVLLVQAVVVILFVLTARLTGLGVPLFLDHGRIGIAIGLSVMASGALTSLPAALWTSRREQALLMLLPGMPHGAALNRALGWRQMRHCLWLWVALLPGLAVLAWAGMGTPLLAFIGMALPMSAWLWRDVARLRAGRPATAFMLVVLYWIASMASLLLLDRQPAALIPWALAVLLLTAGLLAWRWRRLGHLPQALPAGRLA
jgi:hypothetical protein